MIVEMLNELERSGKLRALLNAGLLSSKVIFYREAYLRVQSQMTIHSQPLSLAVSEVAEELRVNERTIRRAIRCMKSDAMPCDNDEHTTTSITVFSGDCIEPEVVGGVVVRKAS